ncbi:carboxypeptidase N subunit 2-like isoform X3 [Branchiostoma floridae]|uniref:Carboxypeptidase N subunit 2-like isoform X3 n=1 Tax=Branchiostoma floridae TaxID=7739 RepID=A0A9J7MRA3_BRAFL|nr:carboxypeptidase N subunit 2-like isoform X3 [Branchiostoma floridae]XP_035676355.1 carboxypeptidase N subunit 2-like isoform X3 [Branchiostoma floridae]
MGEKLPGMLLSILIILKVFGATEASCRITGFTADCSNQNLTSVPQDLPTGIDGLYLWDNLITTLSQFDFSQYGLLTLLYLSKNHITTVNGHAFCNLHKYNNQSELIDLKLSFNHLSNLSADMFTWLANLEFLSLDNNEISDIQAGTFNSTPQLRDLGLYGNKLTKLSADMFTGLENLQTLWLSNNEISDIPFGTFTSTPQLTWLYMGNNKLTSLRSDMFRGLGNLMTLYLNNNEISDIQAGTFNSMPQLVILDLQNNRLTVLNAEMFAELSAISVNIARHSFEGININNNPWQCDCRMLPCRQKMTGSHPFENQIICEGPSNFRGVRLKDISPEDLICEEPGAPNQPQPAPSFSLPVLIGSVCGAVAGTVLIVTIIFMIWRKRKTQNPPSAGQTPPIAFSTISEHDQTGQGEADTTGLVSP